ncbi:uncharacterized protein V2V93DRAFT_374137 [Kockiozyma suomiensis]|uniref:uncharacterized protein n=1 Tax=Kockiozyma suomiensis TaxID=1337062 RepID=UPI0033436741
MSIRVSSKLYSRSLLAARINCSNLTAYQPVSSYHLRSGSNRRLIQLISISRAYATEPPPFDSGDTSSKHPNQSGSSWISKIFRSNSSNHDSVAWESRRVSSTGDEAKSGYEPDAEWEALQRLSNLIRKVKSDLLDSDDLDALHEIEYEIKDAVDELISRLAKEELPVVHARLIEEAWKILYTPQLGRVDESSSTDLVGDSNRLLFNKKQLKRLLYLIVRFDQRSDYHVVLGRKVYEKLMHEVTASDSGEAQEQFMLFVLLLSRNKADNEMLTAFDELLRILNSIDESMAIALVSIVNNVTDSKVQEILVSRLFEIEALDIGAFNVILQAAVESNQRNVWQIYDKVLGNPSSVSPSLLPNLDTYELLFRYVVKAHEPQRSAIFMKDVKDVIFDTTEDGALIPTYDILQNQELYRSYMTACIIADDTKTASVIAVLFDDDGVKPHLEAATWDVWAQWIAYSTCSITQIDALFNKMAEYGYQVTTSSLNGVFRASQVSRNNRVTNRQFCDEVFGLFKAYSVPHDNTSISLRLRDRVAFGDVDAAISSFKIAAQEGLSWDPKTDDMKALFMMLEALAILPDAEFNVALLVELYLAVRVYVDSVDYVTRLAIVKALIKHGEIGTLQDFLKEEMGESFKYEPSTFKELYDVLREAVLESTSSDAAWMMYGCIHAHFIADYETNLIAMRKFCDLGYSEAALELFRHVRKHSSSPPQRDMYSVILRGFARQHYRPGIREVLMCYKIDVNIDPDIELFNAILEASNAILDSYYTYHIWQQMSFSATSRDTAANIDRLPTSETFRLLMRMASMTGAGYADHLWDDFLRFPDVPITLEVVKFYVAAHLESGTRGKAFNIAAVFMPRVVKRLEGMNIVKTEAKEARNPVYYPSSERETTVTDIIEVLFNYVPAHEKKIVQEWAMREYPEEFKNIRLWDFEVQRLDLYDVLPYAIPQLQKHEKSASQTLSTSTSSEAKLELRTGSDLIDAPEDRADYASIEDEEFIMRAKAERLTNARQQRNKQDSEWDILRRTAKDSVYEEELVRRRGNRGD